MRPYRIFQAVSAVILLAAMAAVTLILASLMRQGQFGWALAIAAAILGALLYAGASILYLSRRRSARLERANNALRLEASRRARSEEAVRKLNLEWRRKVADFETLLEVIPIGIAVADDPECQKIRVNPALARMMGVPQASNISKSGPQAAGLGFHLLRNGREIPPAELAMQTAASTGKPVLGDENQLIRSDGTIVEVLNFATPLFDENGKVRGVLNACVDVTDSKARETMRRDLEQRLQLAERRKSLGVMAAGIAHDFNNLLTSIMGQAALAADALPPGHSAAQHVALCLEATERAAALIHKVLSYTGSAHHKPAETSLGKVVEDLRAPLAELAAGNSEIRLAIAASLPAVVADAHEIRRILEHLVRNAVEAADGNKAAGITCIEIAVDGCELTGEEREMVLHEGRGGPGLYVRIQVKDAAGGMPAETAERAFDPFFSTKFVGRGMGLSEVLGIMRAHHGAVRMRTELNAGTSVELFFPACPRKDPAP
jgi:signal transduction histidine kinase